MCLEKITVLVAGKNFRKGMVPIKQTKTKKQEVEEIKESIENSNMPKYEIVDDRYMASLEYKNGLLGTIYVKDKFDYGFHIYHIAEPEATKYSGTHGVLTEMYYNLRDKEYWITRDLKEVKFSERNVGMVFEGANFNEIFKLISTDNNKNMYSKCYEKLGALGREVTNMFSRFLHRLITEYSYYELLYKSGVNISDSRLKIEDPDARKPKDILGLNKSEWKMVSKHGVSLRSFQFSKAKRWEPNDSHRLKASKDMINYVAYIEELNDKYGLEKIDRFVDIESDYLYLNSESVDRFRVEREKDHSVIGIADKYGLPTSKLIEYIYFQCEVSQGMRIGTALGQYRDYMNMITDMGYTRVDRYPKALKTAHDIASMNYNITLDKRQKELWAQAYEEVKSLSGTYKDWIIFAPEEPEDLRDEGNQLGHCVGSYVTNVTRGKCYILFLRNKQDLEKSVVTLEVREGNIVQARGKMNSLPTQEQNHAIVKIADKLELGVTYISPEAVAV